MAPISEGAMAAGAQLARLADREVFALRDGRTFTWADVVEGSRLRGDWEEFEQDARRRLCVTTGGDSDAVLQAGWEFRYARGLVSGDDLKAWLAAWGLSTDDWRGYLRRKVSGAPEGPTGEHHALEPPDDAVAVDAICTGFMERAARRLAEDAALAERAGADTTDLAVLLAAAGLERARLPDADEVARELRRHAVDWTRYAIELLEVATEDMAKEAVLGITLDGQPVSEIAGLSGGRSTRSTTLLADAPTELALHLQSARSGEVVGPIRLASGFAVLVVHERTAPDPEDAALSARAQALVAARAVEREVLSRITWRDAAVR
jgi:hypothetical protein